MNLGRIGVWSGELRDLKDRGVAGDAAAELESLGYTSLFIPGRVGGDVLRDAESLLVATDTLDRRHGHPERLAPRSPGGRGAACRAERALTTTGSCLGLGMSHAPLIDPTERPLPQAAGQDARVPR